MLFSLRFAVLLLSCCSLQPVFADDAIVTDESAAEATVLYNFALLTEWPNLPPGEFRICVLGSQTMLAALEPLKNQRLKEQPVNITNISALTQIQSCQILFVGQSEHDSLGKVAKKIGNAPVLVVSEEDKFDPKNVIISLVAQQGQISFKVNRTAAQKHSLVLSSKLLKLAEQIY
jgi:hypothetical protein